MGCFSAAPSGFHPTGAPLLPKLRGDFAEFLSKGSPARLGLLAPPTCVGLSTGTCTLASGFSRRLESATSVLDFPRHHHSGSRPADFPAEHPRGLDGLHQSPAAPIPPRPRFALTCARGTGISTGCPSPTPFGLGLGPDLPWVDDPSPGTLRLSAAWILTMLLATHAGIRTSAPSTAPSGTASLAGGTLPYHVRLAFARRPSAASVVTLAPFIVGAVALDQ